jgi:hypothetical protein
VKKYPNLHRGVLQLPQDRYCTLTVLYRHQQPSLKIVSRIANSDTLLNFPMALISIPVTFFGDLKAKLKGEELNSMEGPQDRVDELLV